MTSPFKALAAMFPVILACAGCATGPGGDRLGRQDSARQLSIFVGNELQGMRMELAGLRTDLQAMNARLDAMGAPAAEEAPAPPQETAPEPPQETAEPAGTPKTITFGPAGLEEDTSAPEEAAVPHAIIKEWGRSAEIEGVASLKGMICTVPPGTPNAALQRLGRDLRAQYDGFDNLTIDIFDDEAAARAFAENPVANPAHRVVSVARYKNLNQDSVVVFRDGMALGVGP